MENKKAATYRDVLSTPLGYLVFHENSQEMASGSSSPLVSSMLRNHLIVPSTSISLLVTLNEHNYLLWKELIESYVISFGLDDLINPMIPIPL